MRGFILAAGFGTRLRPITDKLPKALVPVCGEPLLAHNLRVLHRSGAFSALGVNSHYLHELMERFQRESSIPFELFYESDKIRGTGGALDFARDFLSGDDAFLIANVDILHKFDIAELASRFVESGRICSQVSIPADSLGTILYDSATGDYLGVAGDREALASSIKPSTPIDSVGANCVRPSVGGILEAEFTGVAFYRREFLDFVNKDDFSIVSIWKRAALAGHAPGIITPKKEASWWMDIGTHEALKKIEAEVNGGRIDLWN
ncbi:MAG: NTP transferase domain-containing protein [Chitinispirillales bacterium]|jgi:mannose-1-phosphate guanylyltransferase|nr:NTP transferase domain-containing protein [Chitinispirillales bacterium]